MLRQLKAFHADHPHGIISGDTGRTDYGDASQLFARGKVPRRYANLPTIPFLVPAVIEALFQSPYSTIVELVPGEADAFCAEAARTHGGLVLTSDSDLLIHDLGPDGAMSFFNQFDVSECNSCGGRSLTTRVSSAREIAGRLGLANLLRFGFEVKEDATIMVAEAVRRSNVMISPLREQRYENFRLEYGSTSAGGSDILDGLPVALKNTVLDPRTSELVLQCLHQKPPWHVYLPFLIEDHSRASAWGASQELRYLAYSLISTISDRKLKPILIEYKRRADDITRTEVKLLSVEECCEYAGDLLDGIIHAQNVFDGRTDAAFWRAFAMIDVLKWYESADRKGPSGDIVEKVINPGRRNQWLLWQEIHLSAQLQALLYGLRVIRQALACAAESVSEMPVLNNLAAELESLPTFGVLYSPLPDTTEEPVDIRKIWPLVKAASPEEDAPNVLAEIGSGKGKPEEATFEKPKKKKRVKKQSTTSVNMTSSAKSASKNMYNLLSNTGY